MSYNNILIKVEYPPYGFILQKDVYTTNLLYAYDQFPLTSLRKRIPFRHHKKENPNKSVIIIRQNGCISDNAKSKHSFYLVNTFKPKHLFKKKLLFPIPKGKSIPLTYMNLYEEISKKGIKYSVPPKYDVRPIKYSRPKIIYSSMTTKRNFEGDNFISGARKLNNLYSKYGII